MKTSSKLLLFFYISVVIFIIASMVLVKRKVNVSLKGNGIKVTKNFRVQDYDGVEVSGNAKIILKQSNLYSLQIKGDSNLLGLVEAKVSDNELIVKLPNAKNSHNFEIIISAPSYESLKFSNGCEVKTNDTLSGEKLTTTLGTGSHGDFTIHYNTLESNSSTGCEVTFKGQAQKGNFDASTGCNIDASQLALEECTLDGSTGVMFTVNASKKLNLELSTGCTVKYIGNPVIRTIKKSTGATVEQLN